MKNKFQKIAGTALSPVKLLIDWVDKGTQLQRFLKIFILSLVASNIGGWIGVLRSPKFTPPEPTYLQTLDTHPLQIFNSVAQCTAAGHSAPACKASFSIAFNRVFEWDTALRYRDNATCERYHPKCIRQSWTSSDKQKVIPDTYTPMLMAWQAATDDLNLAAPLYFVRKPGNSLVLSRADHKEYKWSPAKP